MVNATNMTVPWESVAQEGNTMNRLDFSTAEYREYCALRICLSPSMPVERDDSLAAHLEDPWFRIHCGHVDHSAIFPIDSLTDPDLRPDTEWTCPFCGGSRFGLKPLFDVWFADADSAEVPHYVELDDDEADGDVPDDDG